MLKHFRIVVSNYDHNRYTISVSSIYGRPNSDLERRGVEPLI